MLSNISHLSASKPAHSCTDIAGITMGSKALILVTMLALACAANAAEQMTTGQQLQNEGMLCSFHLSTLVVVTTVIPLCLKVSIRGSERQTTTYTGPIPAQDGMC